MSVIGQMSDPGHAFYGSADPQINAWNEMVHKGGSNELARLQSVYQDFFGVTSNEMKALKAYSRFTHNVPKNFPETLQKLPEYKGYVVSCTDLYPESLAALDKALATNQVVELNKLGPFPSRNQKWTSTSSQIISDESITKQYELALKFKEKSKAEGNQLTSVSALAPFTFRNN